MFWNVVSLIGTVVSIGSAVFGYIQARKARQSKTEAEKVKDYLQEKYSNYEYSQLRTEINLLNKALSSNTTKNNIGNKLSNEATSLITKIKSSTLYNNKKVSAAIQICENALNSSSWPANASTLLDNFAAISRFIDTKIRK